MLHIDINFVINSCLKIDGYLIFILVLRLNIFFKKNMVCYLIKDKVIYYKVHFKMYNLFNKVYNVHLIYYKLKLHIMNDLFSELIY